MKYRSVKTFIIFFVSALAFIIFGTGAIKADSLDIYAPDTVLASSYKTDGKANIIDLALYAHNNKAGFNFTEKMRVKTIVVKTGDTSTTLASSQYTVETDVSIPSTGGYGAPTSNTDGQITRITLKTSEISSISTNSNNTVTVSISFEYRKSCFWGSCKWGDYTSVNYYKGTTKVSELTYNKTNNAFAFFNLFELRFKQCLI